MVPGKPGAWRPAPSLVPLGLNGFFPGQGRHTACHLVLPRGPGGPALILDAGTGLARLAEPGVGELVRGAAEVHVLLSHYHLDHVAGLAYLSGLAASLPPGREVTVWAPAPPLVEADPGEALGRLLNPPLNARPLAELPLRVVPVAAPEVAVGGVPVRLRPQAHPGGSVGIRVADAVAYVTDTAPDPATAGFARGCRVLLHEVWLTDEEAAASPARAGHSWPAGVAEVAARAQVGALAPVHHPPWRDEAGVAALVAALAKAAGLPVLHLREGEPWGPGAG